MCKKELMLRVAQEIRRREIDLQVQLKINPDGAKHTQGYIDSLKIVLGRYVDCYDVIDSMNKSNKELVAKWREND